MAAAACQTEPTPRIAAAAAAAAQPPVASADVAVPKPVADSQPIASKPPAASADVVVPKPVADSQPIASKHQLLGETFVRWFYELLNSENPLCSGSGDFGPHHFWENCTLKLVSKTPDVSEDNYEGSVLVAQRLQALAREELLIFNPNVSAEGVKVRSDPHGLLIIMVCGTIHQHNNCLGIFQQLFGLVRSPLNENTWKVKMTQLQLCSSRVTAVPKLTDSSARELLLPLASSMAVAPYV